MAIKQKQIHLSSASKNPQLKKSTNWVYVLILLGYGLIPVITPNFSTFDSNGPKFLAFSLLNLLVLIYLVINELIKNKTLDFTLFLKSKIGVFYSFLIVLSLLSFVKSLNVIESVVHFGKIFTTFTATCLIAHLLRKDLDLVTFLVVGMTGLLLFDSVYVFVETYNFIKGELKDILYIKGGYSNKNILAAALFIKLPFAIFLLSFKSGWQKKIGLLGVFFGSLSLLILSSRAFYLGLLSVSFFYLVFQILRYYQVKNILELKKIIPYFISVVLAFVIFSSLQRFFYPKSESLYNEDFTGRLATISAQEGGGYRLTSWGHTANLIKENPLLGVGLGNWKIAVLEEENFSKPDFTYHLKAHNDFLETTAEVGFLGLVCFLALFLISFYNLLSYFLGNREAGRLEYLFLSAFGLLAYSFDAFFNFPQDRPEIQSLFAIYLGLSIVVSQFATKSVSVTESQDMGSGWNTNQILSKSFVGSVVLFSILSCYVLYLNFRSLQIQRILKEEQVTGKSLVNSAFLLENFPDIPNLSSTSDPINGLIGKKLNDEKKYQEALEVLKGSNPNPFDARREFYISYAYFNLNELDSAEHYIKLAYQIKPLHFLFTKLYANILESKGQKNEAAVLLDEYLGKYKFDPEAWKYGASLHHQLADKEKVMQLLDSAALYFPAEEGILKLKEFYTYKYYIPEYENASRLYNEGKYSQAIDYFKLSYADFEKYGDPKLLPDFLNSWAYSLLQAGRIDESKEIFNRVAGRFPDNYFSLKNLGFIAFQYEKNYPAAIAFYLKSLQADQPDFFQSYMNLGTIYLIQNQKDLAITNYENSLKHGKSETVIKNLHLLWKEKGDQQKSQYYFDLLTSK